MTRTPLEEIVRQEIETHGRIPFSSFMELALYHSVHGYYVKHGPGRDYYTASQATPVFGRLLARQLAEMWERLDRPDRFDVVDVGAGKGELLDSIYEEARRMPGFREAFRPIAVDPHGGSGGGRSLESLPDGSVTGCILSNELFDALPVRRVRAVGNDWRELFVTTRDGRLRSVLDRATSNAAAHLEWLGILPQDGLQLEICPAASEVYAGMARALRRGYILTVDYGAEQEELLERGSTLRCFFSHTIGSNPLDRIGEQDLTADVNFTALRRAGEEIGLATLGVASQMRFLLALGGAQEVARAMSTMDATAGGAAKNLMLPGGMGERFLVLVQSKGATGPLRGFESGSERT